ALDPFRVEGEAQDETQGNPEPLDYLRQQEPRSLDIDLTVAIESESMRDAGTEPQVIAQSNAKYLYWSPEQQLAHHTVNGCNARPGDLMASGTISGETEDSYGSLLELTWRGTKPMTLPTGEERTFLADGDRVTLSGQASRAGYRVSFGEVTGTIRQAT
ncbi:MAG: fumarylacetoacetate hydrolase family protein, partial [Bacteroidota bacterium]